MYSNYQRMIDFQGQKNHKQGQNSQKKVNIQPRQYAIFYVIRYKTVGGFFLYNCLEPCKLIIHCNHIQKGHKSNLQ